MRRVRVAIAAAALTVTACSQEAKQEVSSKPPQPANAPANEAAPAIPPPETGPDARTPLAEPKGPIDPKSAEAAGQVVQHYGALIEQRRWAGAEKLWGNADSGAQFTLQLKRYREAHLEIGKPGDMEGAAGSIYVTEPVTFYGTDQNGAEFRKSAEVTLRRVNDVSGSTEAQRRWHIERIEWKPAS